MSAWFKTKPKLTPRSQYPVEILRAIHTMENDVRGESMPMAQVADPLVAFQHQAAAQGAPFYADPSILPTAQPVESQPTMSFQTAASPFLTNAPSQVLADPALSEPIETETVLELGQDAPQSVALRQEETPEGVFDLKTWVVRYRFVLGGTIILLFLIGGVVWWWLHRTPEPVQVSLVGAVTESAPTPTPRPEVSKPEVIHYSTSQPNLLSFDTETVTTSSIKTELLKTALTVKQDNLQGPIEFLVRDQNYNPLAFSRLAYLLGASFSADLLAALDENYSLFFVLDGNWVRIGLKLAVKNHEAFVVAQSRDEASLPQALEPFFLDMTTAPKTDLTFHSGLYRGQPVRYANIDPAINLSIDSAVRGNTWFIGTSQNTLRTLLDLP